MSTNVMSMLGEALRAMCIGIPCVFAVLAVFYFAIWLMMRASKAEK